MKKSMKRLLALTLALMLAVVAPFSAAPEVSAASYRGTVTLYGTPEAAIKNGGIG